MINVPTLKPERLISVMENIESWDMLKYEYWFDPEDYRVRIWLTSKFIAVFLDTINKVREKVTGHEPEEFFYSLHREPAQLTLKIVQEFRKNVESNGAKFYVVHLPWENDLMCLFHGDKLAYIELFKELEKFVEIIPTQNNLLDEARKSTMDTLFVKGKGHYSAKGNRVIADVIAEALFKGRGTSEPFL